MEHAEVDGLLRAMGWAERLALQQACIELDAQNIAAVANGVLHRVKSENQSLILDIIDLFRKFPSWSCKFINRKPAEFIQYLYVVVVRIGLCA